MIWCNGVHDHGSLKVRLLNNLGFKMMNEELWNNVFGILSWETKLKFQLTTLFLYKTHNKNIKSWFWGPLYSLTIYIHSWTVRDPHRSLIEYRREFCLILRPTTPGSGVSPWIIVQRTTTWSTHCLDLEEVHHCKNMILPIRDINCLYLLLSILCYLDMY